MNLQNNFIIYDIIRERNAQQQREVLHECTKFVQLMLYISIMVSAKDLITISNDMEGHLFNMDHKLQVSTDMFIDENSEHLDRRKKTNKQTNSLSHELSRDTMPKQAGRRHTSTDSQFHLRELMHVYHNNNEQCSSAFQCLSSYLKIS